MTTTNKIQIESSLSALAKAHQELLAHFESTSRKPGRADKATAHAPAEVVERPSVSRRQRSK